MTVLFVLGEALQTFKTCFVSQFLLYVFAFE